MDTQKVEVPSQVLTPIPIEQIKPSKTNPASRANGEELAGLRESIRLHGVLQPVVVRHATDAGVDGATYELVCGHRRFAAALAAGLTEIPASGVRLDGSKVSFVVKCEDAGLAPFAGCGELSRAGIGWAAVEANAQSEEAR